MATAGAIVSRQHRRHSGIQDRTPGEWAFFCPTGLRACNRILAQMLKFTRRYNGFISSRGASQDQSTSGVANVVCSKLKSSTLPANWIFGRSSTTRRNACSHRA